MDDSPPVAMKFRWSSGENFSRNHRRYFDRIFHGTVVTSPRRHLRIDWVNRHIVDPEASPAGIDDHFAFEDEAGARLPQNGSRSQEPFRVKPEAALTVIEAR